MVADPRIKPTKPEADLSPESTKEKERRIAKAIERVAETVYKGGGRNTDRAKRLALDALQLAEAKKKR